MSGTQTLSSILSYTDIWPVFENVSTRKNHFKFVLKRNVFLTVKNLFMKEKQEKHIGVQISQLWLLLKSCNTLSPETEHQPWRPAASPGGQGVGAHGGLPPQSRFLRSSQHRQLSQPHDKLPGIKWSGHYSTKFQNVSYQDTSVPAAWNTKCSILGYRSLDDIFFVTT